MNEFWEMYESKMWVEPFLIYAILLFLLSSLVLFVLLMRSRIAKIKNQKQGTEFEAVIERLLMSVLFTGTTFHDIKSDPQYVALHKNKLFRELMMVSVINLHKNYEGMYAKKLEQFYFASDLITDSFSKLKSRKWEINCKGINELAEMNTTKMFNVLVKVSRTKNRILQITALNACVKLNGTNGLIHLVSHPYPIDEWTQVNILAAMKQGNIENTSGIELLLGSKNLTVIRLGLKIIQTLFLSQHVPVIQRLIATTESEWIRNEAVKVVQMLDTHDQSIANV